MFSALKKLTRNDDKCPAPVPMSSSLQKKFSKGVHYNMKILIKGDRNVGKSCLLQRLQGGSFIEEYAPTEQIQVAPINWTYKNTDHIVKVEVWEVVDKGCAKKKQPLGLKLDNAAAPAGAGGAGGAGEPLVLDATFLDVYKNANGVILMFDITKPWTFEYVVKELAAAPAALPAAVLGNHCDMQHHRQVPEHRIEQALYEARAARAAAGGACVRYAESSMRNAFGLRFLHKFLGAPFLRLQRASLLEQLRRNQRDADDAETELDAFQNSEECHYNTYVDRLAKKRQGTTSPAATATAPGLPGPPPGLTGTPLPGAPGGPLGARSPSIVLGAGKPIVSPGVNPLLAQSLNPAAAPRAPPQTQYVSPELMKRHTVSLDCTPQRPHDVSSGSDTPARPGAGAAGPAGAGAGMGGGWTRALDEFYAGALDNSFLDDVPADAAPPADSDSDEADGTNPMVDYEVDDLEAEAAPGPKKSLPDQFQQLSLKPSRSGEFLDPVSRAEFVDPAPRAEFDDPVQSVEFDDPTSRADYFDPAMDSFVLWAQDPSSRRSPEGGEDPYPAKEPDEKVEKKHKKKKSKDKESGERVERREKRKHKKSRSERSPQAALLQCAPPLASADDYDSL